MLYKNICAHHLQRLKHEVDSALAERKQRSEERVKKHLESTEHVQEEKEKNLKNVKSKSDSKVTANQVHGKKPTMNSKSSTSHTTGAPKPSKITHKAPTIIATPSNSILDLIPETWGEPSSPSLISNIIAPLSFYSKPKTSDKGTSQPSSKTVELAQESERKKRKWSMTSFESELAQMDKDLTVGKKRLKSRTVPSVDVCNTKTEAIKQTTDNDGPFMSKKLTQHGKGGDTTANKTIDSDRDLKQNSSTDDIIILNDSSGSDCMIIEQDSTPANVASLPVDTPPSGDASNSNDSDFLHNHKYLDVGSAALGGTMEVFSTSPTASPGTSLPPAAIPSTSLLPADVSEANATNHFCSNFDNDFDPLSFLPDLSPDLIPNATSNQSVQNAPELEKPKDNKMSNSAAPLHKPVSESSLTNLTKITHKVKLMQRKPVPKPQKIPKRVIDKGPPKVTPKPTYSVLKKKEIVFNGK